MARQEQTGKAAGSGSHAGVWIAVTIISLTVLLGAAYAGLCVRAGKEDIAPRTYATIPGVAEPVDIGGTDFATAARRLEAAARINEARTVTVTCGEESVAVPGDCFELNDAALLEQLAAGEEPPFLERGIRYLGSLLGSAVVYPLSYSYGPEGAAEVEDLLASLAGRVNAEAVDAEYAVEGDLVVVTPGSAGASLDVAGAKETILRIFSSGGSGLDLEAMTVEADILTAQEINDRIYVAPDAAPLGEDGKLLPAVVGVSIDVAAAQALMDDAAPGESVTIPLVYTQPDYENAGAAGLLYQDLLSECRTYISGSEGRLTNITLASGKCNGLVLLPGETFDYNVVVGQRTPEAGYQSAPAFFAGDTVMEYGGGICQVSSSLYYCAVYADLEIVTRYNHGFAVGYVPDGLDAAVSWGGPEFRFTNNTPYPIRIEFTIEGRNMTARFYGTNPEGKYVRTEQYVLSVTNYKEIYQPDETVPLGTTRESVSAYTGRTVEVYRNVYAADGTLLSRTFENKSVYEHRDRIILFNPSDAASLGLNPDGTPLPEVPEVDPPEAGGADEPVPDEPSDPVIDEPNEPATGEPSDPVPDETGDPVPGETSDPAPDETGDPGAGGGETGA